MGLAAYDITGTDKEWRVRHDGKAENVCETKNSPTERLPGNVCRN
jgi:hypothetical protein